MKKVECWVTTDGMKFEKKSEANLHQAKMDFTRDLFEHSVYGKFSIKDVVRAIQKDPDLFITFASQFK